MNLVVTHQARKERQLELAERKRESSLRDSGQAVRRKGVHNTPCSLYLRRQVVRMYVSLI